MLSRGRSLAGQARIVRAGAAVTAALVIAGYAVFGTIATSRRWRSPARSIVLLLVVRLAWREQAP